MAVTQKRSPLNVTEGPYELTGTRTSLMMTTAGSLQSEHTLTMAYYERVRVWGGCCLLNAQRVIFSAELIDSTGPDLHLDLKRVLNSIAELIQAPWRQGEPVVSMNAN